MASLKGVYLVGEAYKRDDSIVFKIGKSSNVKARISTIQTGNPRPLKIIAVLTHLDPAMIECYLHKLFDEYRLQGEWFEMKLRHIDMFEHHFNKLHDALGEFYYFCQDLPFPEWEWELKKISFKIIDL